MMFIIILIFLSIISILKIYIKLNTSVCRSNVCLINKTILITGGTSGLGFATALKLAARGANVVIADVVDGQESVRKIVEETGNPNVRYKYLDVGDFKCLRKFCKEFLESEQRLDVLINNAGITDNTGSVYPDGSLKIMAVNYYGAFLLTHLLISLLRKTEKSRVVFVSSCLAFVHGLKNPRDLNKPVENKNIYRQGFQQYGNSKLCMLVATNLLAKKGIHANSVFPGYVYTPMHNKTMAYLKKQSFSATLISPFTYLSIYIFGKTSSEGAETILDAAISKELDDVTGKFFYECKPHSQPKEALDEEFAKVIWQETEKIVELTDDEKIK